MYLLFLDESGTHGGSPVFILGGIAIHEQDTYGMQLALERAVASEPTLRPAGGFELHAAEMRSPRTERSRWFGIPIDVRKRALDGAVGVLGSFESSEARRPVSFFAAVVERSYPDYEERAYEEVLHRFDEMLTRQGHESPSGMHERGLVIHDRRVVERDIQSQTEKWRRASGRIGRLTHLADVPLFADSKATRLLQAADLVTYALWRYYGLPVPDDSYLRVLWPRFDAADGVMHGLVHVWRGFSGGGSCCPACQSRR